MPRSPQLPDADVQPVYDAYLKPVHVPHCNAKCDGDFHHLLAEPDCNCHRDSDSQPDAVPFFDAEPNSYTNPFGHRRLDDRPR